MAPAAAAIACSEVCKDWRAAYFAAPELWRGGQLVLLGGFEDPPDASSWPAAVAVLRRMSGLLQHLRIEGRWETDWRRRPRGDRLPAMLAALGPAPPLLSAVLEVAEGAPQCLPDTLRTLSSWPALGYLELCLPAGGPSADQLAALLAQLPALASLHLLGFYQHCWEEPELGGDLRPLSRLTRLTELRLHGAFTAAPPPHAMPALRHFEFVSADWSNKHGKYGSLDFWDVGSHEAFEVRMAAARLEGALVQLPCPSSLCC